MAHPPDRTDSLQLARLLEELAAMVRADRPLVAGLRTLEDARLGQLGRIASSLRGELEAGHDLEAALAQLDRRDGPQAATAFRLAIRSQSVEPLQRLATSLRQRRQWRWAGRTAMIYPLLVTVVGYGLWVAVFAKLVSWGSLDGYERELFPAPVLAVGSWLRFFWWLPPLVVAAAVALYAGFVRQRPASRYASWLPGRMGRLALFCETLALQLEAAVPVGEAVQAAGRLADDAGLIREAEAVAARATVGGTPGGEVAGSETSAAVAGPAALPPMVTWLITQLAGTGTMSAASVALQLRALAAWYAARQRSQQHFVIRFLPALIVAIFGGSLAFIYMFAVLRPLYARIGDFG
jgi:type II secretory pathway component PulF